MKTFSNSEKVLALTQLLINGTFVTDLQRKQNIFNFFFIDQ